MTDIVPTIVEFSQFVQGVDAIKSKNKQFRFNSKIMADLKVSAVYQYLIRNDYFNDALRIFQLQGCINNELIDEKVYEDFVVLSLMGIVASALYKYFHAKSCPPDWIKAVTKKEKMVYVDACDLILEGVLNPHLIPLPLADSMELERLLLLSKKMLLDKELAEYPERSTGIKLIWEREFVYHIVALYMKEYGDSYFEIFTNLSRIVLNESHEYSLDLWIKAGKKKFLTMKKCDSISRKENKIYEKYYR